MPLFKRAMIVLLGIITVASVITWYNLYREDGEMLTLEAQALQEPSSKESLSTEKIIVYVSGEVVTPGIVKLPLESRVAHAVELSGGVLTSADLDAINMALALRDGMHIKIPKKKVYEEQELEAPNHAQDGKVNLNTASQKEFDTLPGIGPTMAERIFNYRKQNGRFQSIEDIKKVKGIGEGRYEKLKDKIKI